MPTITIQDLNNAKTDVDHIAAIATSTAPTAVDRLGHSKLTMRGAVDTIKAFNPRGARVGGETYLLKDIYTEGGYAYVTVVDSFVSGTLASDLAAGVVALYQGATKSDLLSLVYLGDLLTAFGNSFTAGITGDGVFSPDAYAFLISRRTGIPLVNKAISGSLIIDLGSNFYNTLTGEADTFFTMTGYNDGRVYGPSALGAFTYRGVLQAMLVWLSLPAAAKILAISEEIAYSGDWNILPDVYNNKQTSKFTLEVGATAQTKIKGSVIYIGHTRSTSTPAVFNVTIDGRSYGNFTNENYAASNSGLVYGPSIVRIPGLQSSKEHNVIITHVSGGQFYLDYIAGNGGANSFAPGPRVFSGNTVRMVDYSHELSSDAVVDNYNFIHASVIAELASDGLNIMRVDTSSGYDVVAMTGADGVHPNPVGEEYLAETFLQAMSTASLPVDRNRGMQPYSPVMGLCLANPENEVPVVAGAFSNVPFDKYFAPPGWIFLGGATPEYFPQTPGYVEMLVTVSFKGPILAGRYYVDVIDGDTGATYVISDGDSAAQVDARTVSGSVTVRANGLGSRFHVRAFASVNATVSSGVTLTRFAAKFLGQ